MSVKQDWKTTILVLLQEEMTDYTMELLRNSSGRENLFENYNYYAVLLSIT